MFPMLQEVSVQCPYCGEQINVVVDGSEAGHRYIEDCEVCCRPIELQAEVDAQGQLLGLLAHRDDD